MASWQQEIRYGQSVWDDFRNGYIADIDWQERTVYVDYYDKGHQTYEFGELIGNWSENLNQWVIPQ